MRACACVRACVCVISDFMCYFVAFFCVWCFYCVCVCVCVISDFMCYFVAFVCACVCVCLCVWMLWCVVLAKSLLCVILSW